MATSMTRFFRSSKPSPIDQFLEDLAINRPALEEAYLNAWIATKKANRLQDELLQAQFVEPDESDPLGVSWLHQQADVGDLNALNREAQAQDRRANFQSMLVIHSADQSLRRLGFGLRIPAKRMKGGFGKPLNKVPLTTLLWETMNCERHVRQWDDDPNLVFPYDSAETTGKGNKRPLDSIKVLQQALAIGKHERIYEAPCWTLLKIFDGEFLDGKLGESQPDYGRFEAEVITAAREIIIEGAPKELAGFDERIRRLTAA